MFRVFGLDYSGLRQGPAMGSSATDADIRQVVIAWP